MAIAGVLAFHVFPAIFPGGFVGVDVFFVVSGYLITSIILRDMAAGQFSFREFYIRRVQRLAPNAVVTVLVSTLLALVLLTPYFTMRAARHGLATVFSLSNFYLVRSSVFNYWGDNAGTYPFLHTWSLSVEEQFYFLFPALLLLLTRLAPKRYRFCIYVLAGLSFIAGVALLPSYARASFYLLPTRGWELLIGAALAGIMASPTWGRERLAAMPQRWLETVGWLGVVLVLVSFLLLDDASQFPGWLGILPCMGSLLILVAVIQERTTLAGLLSTRPMRVVGKASYSIYLWHWPLIVIGATYAELAGVSRLTGVLCGASTGLVLSLIAFVLVERPLRRRTPGRHSRLIAIAGLVVACSVTVAGLSLWRPVADSTGLFDPLVSSSSSYDSIYYGVSGSAMFAGPRYDVVYPPAEPWPTAEAPFETGGVVHSWGGSDPRVVLIGSSHATMYGATIDSICEEMGVSVAFLCAGAEWLFAGKGDGEDAAFYEARDRWISTWRPDVVIAVEKWDGHQATEEFQSEILEFVNALKEDAQAVVLVTQPPVLSFGNTVNPREYVSWYQRFNEGLPKIFPDDAEPTRQRLAQMFETMVATDPRLLVVRADLPFLDSDGSVRYAVGRTFFYANGDHLSDDGADVLRPQFADAVAKALALSTGP